MATPIPVNHAEFGREDLLATVRGEASGPSWQSVVGVVTDSREVRPGNLFVALRGERFDAHQFAAQAASAGATAVLVEQGTTLSGDVSVVEVADTLRALGDLAKAHRASWNGRLVGITGSVGKTTTKDLTAAALRACGHRVLATRGNLNNRVGVPMTLLELDAHVDVAVIEMGTSEPGEIARLAEIAAPDVAVVTRASLAHTEGLGSVAAVADEKVSLLHALSQNGVAIAYGDDAALKKRASVVSAKRKLYYGRAVGCDVRVFDWDADAGGTHARFQVRGQELAIDMQLLGEGAVLNAAAALTVALGLGEPVDAAARGIAEVAPLPGRLQMQQGVAGRLVVDDTYNSNPASVEVALDAARAIAQKRNQPLVVVLGDMKELGLHAEEAHQRVGERVSEADAFLFVGCGEGMHAAVAAANAHGTDTLWFESSAACEGLADRLPFQSVVLVKGSRSMQMERVVASLTSGGER